MRVLAILWMIFSLCFNSVAMAVDPKEVEKMVAEFEKNGLIPEGEGARVRREIQNITPQQWKEIESLATQYQEQMNSPDVKNNLPNAVQHINTDSDTFKKMTGELEKIMKERKHLID